MISKITICNLALAQLGQSPITSLTQEDEKARRLNLFYEPVRDEVLRTHHWAFAGASESLALLETEVDANGNFCYKYPTDALFIRKVYDTSAPQTLLPFREAYNTDLHSRVLLIPCRQAIAEYTCRITDENLFDPAFVKAFSLALACDLAVSLTADTALGGQLLQKYMLSLEEARRSNMAESRATVPEHDAFTEVR